MLHEDGEVDVKRVKSEKASQSRRGWDLCISVELDCLTFDDYQSSDTEVAELEIRDLFEVSRWRLKR